jgi:hypothetical protein
MSVSSIKIEILETMVLNGKPMKAIQIAKETKKEFQPVMGHLLGLTKMGYVALPEKGQYVITEKGKKTLGIPETDKENAGLPTIAGNPAFLDDARRTYAERRGGPNKQREAG